MYFDIACIVILAVTEIVLWIMATRLDRDVHTLKDEIKLLRAERVHRDESKARSTMWD